MVEIAWTDDAAGWEIDADLENIQRRLLEAIAEVVDREADNIVREAQEYAPVRKVFGDKRVSRITGGRMRRYLKPITATQLNSEAPVRKVLGMPGVVNVGGRSVMSSTLRREHPYLTSRNRTDAQKLVISGVFGYSGGILRFKDARRLTSQGHFEDKNARFLLSSRGKYEYENAAKRGAISVEHTNAGRTIYRLGGRLRASIHRLPMERSGLSFSVEIVAGGQDAPYAKYVEFGTRHAAAQPFMRPAAARARQRFRRSIQSTLNAMKREGTGRRLR